MSHHRKTGSFKAKDSSGIEYTIEVLTEYFSGTGLTDGVSENETGFKKLRTSGGKDVNPLGGNQFEILSGLKPIVVTTFDPRYIGGVK